MQPQPMFANLTPRLDGRFFDAASIYRPKFLTEGARMPDRVGWFAVIYSNGSHDLVGSVRRSKRLHWTMREARHEMEGWVFELRLGKISWDTVEDNVIVARLPRHIAVISNMYLPVDKLPALNGANYTRSSNSATPPIEANRDSEREVSLRSSVPGRDLRSRHRRFRRTGSGSVRRT